MTDTGSNPTARYKIVNAFWTGNRIALVERDDEDRVSRRFVPAEYAFFIRASDLTDEYERKIRQSRHVSGMRREGSWWRVRYRDRNVMREHTRLDGGYARDGITVWEADVHPVRRFLTDHDVEIQRPKRCYLDLECDPRQTVPAQIAGRARVLSWAIVDDDGRKIYGLLEADDDDAEAELLRDLWHELLNYDQVCAWAGDRYDQPVLVNRSKALDIVIEPRRWLWLDHLEVYRRYNASASESGDEKESMALNRVAQAVLGRGKLDHDPRLNFETWQSEPMMLVDYNIEDAVLMRDIEAATGYLDLHFTVCQTCTTLPDSRGTNPTNFVEGYMLRLGLEHDRHFPTQHLFDDGTNRKYAGAYVMDPTRTGIIEGVHVCDFSAMYPSIIISWNMSPETFVGTAEAPAERPSYMLHESLAEAEVPVGCCVAPLTRHIFRTDVEGLLSIALKFLMEQRDVWKRRRAAEPPNTPRWKECDRMASAFKIAINSFYGVVGSIFSRFNMREVAEAITQAGKWLLLKTHEAANNAGFESFYGDTDSLFIVGGSNGSFRAFVQWCNTDLYPRLLRERGCSINTVKLGYEKKFSDMLMMKKKRYAAVFEHYEGTAASADSKMEIKGLEYKRGDSLQLARELQYTVLRMLLIDKVRTVEPYRELLRAWQHRILNEQLALEDVRMSQQLSREISGYARRVLKDGKPGKLPIHVEVAQMMAEEGKDVGEGVRIEYVVTDGSSTLRAIPADRYDGTNADRYYLWEQQIYPPAQRVLAAALKGHRWRDYQRVRPGGGRSFGSLGQGLLFDA